MVVFILLGIGGLLVLGILIHNALEEDSLIVPPYNHMPTDGEAELREFRARRESND